ncbi:hypothetical protein DBV05_g12758 [Lasiodiplodia theobromae]|uniref:Heterokaryon incompatibility domain-containing protein n=1 Tax=Lasiodiplodia theobromae TaxID=45133 RepID=A0A5N5CT87_9PEZI|nr:hypothetical protein DBV05_g12758 [Lasiodiplodia theobromae]
MIKIDHEGSIYCTAAIVACTALSRLATQAITVQRPPGYLENNEAGTGDGASMLVATHQNAMEWHLFTGSRAVVDTLLNKTMFAIPPHQTALTGPVVVARWLRLAHALQLLAMTFTAAQKGWDGVCLVVLLALNAIGRWRMREGSLASWWLAVEGVSRLPTHDDVWRILQDAIGFRYPDGQKPTRPFWTRDATEGFTDILDTFYKDLSPDKRLENAKNLCREWCILIADPNGHWELLNQAFAERLHIHFDSIKEPPGHYVRQATELLARLSTAKFTHYNPDDETSCAELDPRYFTSQEAPRVIQNLNLVSLVDTNTIRVVLWFLVTEGLTAGSLERYLFFLTEQLEAALHLSVGNGVGPTQLLLIRAFLWKSWQRATILFRWYILDRKLNVGGRLAGDTFAAAISRHHKRLAASVGHPLVVAVPQSSEIPPYMCQWAFELLRTNRATSATDFSHFLHRYNQAFGSLPARCVPIPTTADSFQQCPGQSPAQCRRFTGAVIKDQSVHAAFCGGSCQRLYWDKECYVSVREGARAVALDMAEDGLLKYCSASETTMAISHVWSHGQGGRPENVESSTGFNSCLHQKYSAIARRFGCQSYWMDTPCIPEDHDLRKEAIKNINQVFEASQFTLVCDRDIMTIDVRKRHDDMIGTYESLLAALLVCDWNARAWTLLEGYQGRENIHLLCKDDEIIRLADIIDVVHRAGDIVLGNMCLAMDHLIPLRGPRIKDPQDKRFSVEQSGRLLSHRHASRTGDEIVIWSLLRGGLFNTAEDFWRNHSTVIQTGFLISDAPRISDVPGMGWAPARPDLPPATDVVS